MLPYQLYDDLDTHSLCKERLYRAYPRISNLSPPTPSITERAAVIQKAMAEIVKLRAKQAINSALYYRNGPNITLVHDLPPNSKVLVWRKSGN
jgi:hypothetical protein